MFKNRIRTAALAGAVATAVSGTVVAPANAEAIVAEAGQSAQQRIADKLQESYNLIDTCGVIAEADKPSRTTLKPQPQL